MRRAASHRLRFAAGVAASAAVGLWLCHALTANALADAAAEAEARKATVALQAVTALVRQSAARQTGVAEADAEALRRLSAQWQKATPSAAQLRVAKGMQLLASTAAGDAADRAAPRRLQREEKPLYDRAQRLATAAQTNRDEGSLKAEIEIGWLPGPRLSLAKPLELEGAPAGVVELETVALPPAPQPGWAAFVLAFFAALAAFVLLSLLAGEKRLPLALSAVACLGAALLVLGRWSIAVVESERRSAAAAVAQRVQEQAALVQSLAPGAPPPALDVDVFGRPRAEVAPADAVFPLRRALLSADAIALLLLLLTGLGAFNALGTTLRKNRQAYAYVAPAIFGMLVLVFYPFSYGITLSFTDSNIYNTGKSIPEIWVGLRNYAEILGQFAFARRTGTGLAINYLNFYWTLLFTIIWTVCNVTLGVTSGLFLALILNTKALAFRPIYRVLLILPWAIPNYITALIWKGMFHQQFGVINQVLQMFGGHAVNWFDHPFTSFLTAWATNAWLSFPFMMVVALGALQSIPADLYEAARVDGASRWQQFRAITLPSLRPALVPAVILSVVWTFNMFNIIYLVTAGQPDGATEILVTQAYKYAFERYRYGYAAAYSTVIFGILLVYGTIQNRLSKATEA